MSIIFEEDLHKYIDEEDIQRQSKWGGAIYLPKGYALNEFKEQYALDEDELTGDGFWSSLGSAANWVGKNSSTIENIAGAAGKIAELGISIAKGAEEVKNIREMREKAKQAKPEAVANMILNPDRNPDRIPDRKPENEKPASSNSVRPWSSFFTKEKNNTTISKDNLTGDGFRILT